MNFAKMLVAIAPFTPIRGMRAKLPIRLIMDSITATFLTALPCDLAERKLKG
jgi:hypothetical protein